MLVPGVSEALIWAWLYLRLVLFTCRPRRTHYHPTPSHKHIHTGVPASSPRPTTLSLSWHHRGLVCYTECMWQTVWLYLKNNLFSLHTSCPLGAFVKMATQKQMYHNISKYYSDKETTQKNISSMRAISHLLAHRYTPCRVASTENVLCELLSSEKIIRTRGSEQQGEDTSCLTPVEVSYESTDASWSFKEGIRKQIKVDSIFPSPCHQFTKHGDCHTFLAYLCTIVCDLNTSLIQSYF